jgi:hypothetical protein
MIVISEALDKAPEMAGQSSLSYRTALTADGMRQANTDSHGRVEVLTPRVFPSHMQRVLPAQVDDYAQIRGLSLGCCTSLRAHGDHGACPGLRRRIRAEPPIWSAVLLTRRDRRDAQFREFCAFPSAWSTD